MTIDELFDLVAVVAIMHAADTTYEPKAKKALRKLKKLENDPLVVKHFGRPKPNRKWNDFSHFQNAEGFSVTTKEVYDSLFVEIIEEEAPDWKSSYERWGAHAWHDASGEYVFSGDGCGQQPWYETAALLRERIQTHEKELAYKKEYESCNEH